MTNDVQNDSLLPISHHSVHLPIFEGPLDLLLYLIKKNEIDIYDIPIESVTRQYLEILNNIEKKDLELTGEFFVMAATLMLIKSRLLLPKQQLPEEEDEEAGEDPRWELVQQLIEYKRLKEQTQGLEFLISQSNDLIRREVHDNLNSSKEIRKLKNITNIEIWNIFNKVLQRLAEKIVVGEIYEEHISVSEQMKFVLKAMVNQPRFLFSSLFMEKQISINILIATFLAILELTRLDKLRLEQVENFGDILCISHN